MDRSFDVTAPVPHRLLSFGANGVRVELAANRVVEQEACIAKGLKRRFLYEPMLVETAKKVFAAGVMPTTNMWCAQTERLMKPIETVAATMIG